MIIKRLTPENGPISHADRVHAYLKERLLEGGLEPGDALSTEQISAALNVSRSPVMEALKRLEAEGFIQVFPQVGSRVIHPDPDEVADFYRLFAANEAVIAELAAERRSAEEARNYARIVKEVASAANKAGSYSSRDPQYRILNRRRYDAMHQLAHSRVASELAAAMWDRADFYSRIAFGSIYFAKWVRELQARLDKAISRSDGGAAKATVYALLMRAGELISEELKEKSKATQAAQQRWKAERQRV